MEKLHFCAVWDKEGEKITIEFYSITYTVSVVLLMSFQTFVGHIDVV